MIEAQHEISFLPRDHTNKLFVELLPRFISTEIIPESKKMGWDDSDDIRYNAELDGLRANVEGRSFLERVEADRNHSTKT